MCSLVFAVSSRENRERPIACEYQCCARGLRKLTVRHRLCPYSTNADQNSSCDNLVSVGSPTASVPVRLFAQSFGRHTRLNFGAGAESLMLHSSISSAKKAHASPVISLSQSNARRWSSLIFLRDPHDHLGTGSCRVGQEFA